ncbi:MAG: arabinosidase [Bacteroidales bacterium]|nr:arabinosidase [Bacteroidales bacterium]
MLQMKNTFLLVLAMSGLLFSLSSCQRLASDDVAYIFTSFREPSTQGMQYLYSLDGLHWDTLPGIWLRPEVGNDTTYIDAWTGEVQAPNYYPEERVLRDPSIVRGPDGTFHLVWTTQWMGSRGFGYASSTDLIHWSEQRVIDVMADIPTNNVWAPELFYDDEQQQFLIIWSSQINPKDYTAADTLGTNFCHRLWYTTTRDFQTFTPAQRYYDPGFNSIDGYLLKRNTKDYVLVVKDNRKPGFSNLFCVFSDSPYGPFHTFDNIPAGTTPTTTFGRTFSEGPCALHLGNEWIIYFDQYHPQEYGAVSTRDFLTFTPIPERISVPANHKHGTIVQITRPQLDAIINHAEGK